VKEKGFWLTGVGAVDVLRRPTFGDAVVGPSEVSGMTIFKLFVEVEEVKVVLNAAEAILDHVSCGKFCLFAVGWKTSVLPVGLKVKVDANPIASSTPHAPMAPKGPITRARRKKLQADLSSLLHTELKRETLIEEATLIKKEPRLVTLLQVATSAVAPTDLGSTRRKGPFRVERVATPVPETLSS